MDITISTNNSTGTGGAINTIVSGSDINNTLILNAGVHNKTSDTNTSINFSGKNVLIKCNGAPDQVVIDA